MTTKPNLYQKLLAISKAIGHIEKDGTNAHFKYKYVTEAQVMAALQSACTENGVTIIPDAGMPTQAGNITTVNVKYTVVDADDPECRVEFHIPGQGQDSGDKGIYKALTGSYKYMAMKLFQLSTDDDPENDSKDSGRAVATKQSFVDAATPRREPAQAARPPAAPTRTLDSEMYVYNIPYKVSSTMNLKAMGGRFKPEYGEFQKVWVFPTPQAELMDYCVHSPVPAAEPNGELSYEQDDIPF